MSREWWPRKGKSPQQLYRVIFRKRRERSKLGRGFMPGRPLYGGDGKRIDGS